MNKATTEARFNTGIQERFLDKREVLGLLRISQSTLYYWIQKGDFPRPVKLGTRRAVWREKDVAAWIDARIALGGGEI